ncbi:MAG: ERCC4 domain-containing protein, partial [Candidatus Bathyarchaeia archaeon]
GDVKRAVIGAYATIHALKILELLETQGPEASKDYLNGLRERVKARSTASARLFLGDRNVAEAAKLVDELIDSGTGHPKMPELVRLVKESLSRGSRRIIIFTNYRSTASKLADLLNSSGAGVSAARLVGHASRADDRGLSEKAQTLILDDFKNGSFNVLIATQVGEEGLDIAECDHVIFYDTVPSAIRYIQRRGRTGRRGPGRATILIAQGTRDEAYYWISRRREKMMAEALDEISRTERGQPPLEEFMRPTPQRAVDEANVRIIVDTREGPSQVVKELSRLGVKLELKPLLYGDYVLSDRVTVERKTSEDLASSIIDGRLFEQASNLKASYERPILLIEGETLYTSRNIRPEAVIGAVASLLADYGLPVVWSTSPAETALLLSSIARREQTGAARQPRIRGEKPYTSPSRLQEYIVAGLPQVDMTLARRLLKRFRTVEGVFTASAGELKEVEGIGEKKSEKIREALTREYDGG